jgi:ecotin
MLRFAPASIVRRACLILLLVGLSGAALSGRADERAADEPTAEAAADPEAIDPEAIKNLKAAYPAAPAGKTRHVILLPHKERGAEGDVKVEIVAGRTIDTDGVNTVRFGGEFRERDIPGWGFSYFEVDALGAPLSTRIAPAPGTPTVKTFVAGPRMLVRYNSRLPLVVYAPEGTEIRWRLWHPEGDLAPAEAR